MTIKISESIKKGKGFWKFNTSLLKDKKYINELKTLVNECKERYGQLRGKNLAWDLTKVTVTYVTYVLFFVRESFWLHLLLEGFLVLICTLGLVFGCYIDCSIFCFYVLQISSLIVL